MLILEKCRFCGLENCVAHKKYVDRCDECGKRYHKYTSYKSQQKKGFTWAREHLLEAIRLEYKDLKAEGYKVPTDIE